MSKNAPPPAYGTAEMSQTASVAPAGYNPQYVQPTPAQQQQQLQAVQVQAVNQQHGYPPQPQPQHQGYPPQQQQGYYPQQQQPPPQQLQYPPQPAPQGQQVAIARALIRPRHPPVQLPHREGVRKGGEFWALVLVVGLLFTVAVAFTWGSYASFDQDKYDREKAECEVRRGRRPDEDPDCPLDRSGRLVMAVVVTAVLGLLTLLHLYRIPQWLEVAADGTVTLKTVLGTFVRRPGQVTHVRIMANICCKWHDACSVPQGMPTSLRNMAYFKVNSCTGSLEFTPDNLCRLEAAVLQTPLADRVVRW